MQVSVYLNASSGQFLNQAVELDTRMHHLPSELSGGQLGVARVLWSILLILADETRRGPDVPRLVSRVELLTELMKRRTKTT